MRTWLDESGPPWRSPLDIAQALMALTSVSNRFCESDDNKLGCVGLSELRGFPSTNT